MNKIYKIIKKIPYTLLIIVSSIIVFSTWYLKTNYFQEKSTYSVETDVLTTQESDFKIEIPFQDAIPEDDELPNKEDLMEKDSSNEINTDEIEDLSEDKASEENTAEYSSEELPKEAVINDELCDAMPWLSAFNSGITPIEIYGEFYPVNRYYTELGIRALDTNAEYKVEPKSYFDDACWIGDSRVLGIYDYSGFNSDFYCDNGYCFYNYINGKQITYQNTREKMTLETAMKSKKYKKIYIMMGINDCGYMTTTDIQSYMGEMLSMILKEQPEAIIFLCANLHVGKNAVTDVYTLGNINAKNVALASHADGERVFYIDYNYLFTDDEGYLKPELTFDGFHLYGKDYGPWVDFFMRHGIHID